jgi:hypothetical protein
VSSPPHDGHDSSNVCFGKRKPGVSGDDKCDAGGGICAGVPGVGAVVCVACADVGLAVGLGLGLMRHVGEGGAGKDDEATGASRTSRKPLCGPRRLRINEKCSQSWYLMRVACAGPTHAT